MSLVFRPSGRALLCALVLIAGLSVAVLWLLSDGGHTPSTSTASSASLTSQPAAKGGDEARTKAAEDRRVKSLRGTATKAKRAKSRSAFRGLSDREARSVALRSFPGQMRAPLFSTAKLGRGMRVVEFRGAREALVRDENGKRQLLQSSAPLQARDDAGELAPVDLTLSREDDGQLQTRVSNAPVIIDATSPARLTLKTNGVSASLRGARTRSAQVVEDRAFFANVQTDTDAGITPLPDGAEVFFIARSPAAAERFTLDVQLPVGAVLQRATAETTTDPIPGDPPRSIRIVKDDEVIGYVHPPIAHDADGIGIPAEMSIDGDDIRIDVPHRGKPVRYPLSIDPEFRIGFQGNNSRTSYGFEGWTWHQVRTGANDGYFGSAQNNCDYYCGLYQSHPTGTVLTNSSNARWQYTSLPDTYISRATFGGIQHSPLAAYNYNHSRWFQGVATTNYAGWEASWYYVNQSGAVAYTNPFGPNASAGYGLTHDFMRSGAASIQNIASFGQQVQNAFGCCTVSTVGQNWKGSTAMSWSNIYMTDNYVPIWAERPASRDWRDDQSATQSQAIAATDRGLGVLRYKLAGATSSNAVNGYIPTYCSLRLQPPCANTTDTRRTMTYKLAEGVNTLSLEAEDVAGNKAPATWTEKIDRSKPTLSAPGGTLWEARNRVDDRRFQGVYGPTATLTATATDAGSGIREIEVYLNGVSQKSRGGYSPNGALNWNWNLATNPIEDGTYTVKIVARDKVAGQAGVSASRHETSSDEIPSDPFVITVDRAGDVVSAEAWTGDPQDAASDNDGREWLQTGTANARMEDLGRYRTLRRVTCSSTPADCLELREQAEDDTPDADPVIATIDEDPAGARLQGESALFDASQRASVTPVSVGQTRDLAPTWQTLPPARGTTYARYVSSEQVVIDDASATVTEELFVDQATRLPLQLTLTVPGEAPRHTYFVYTLERLAATALGTEFFALGSSSQVETRSMPARTESASPSAPQDDEALVAIAKRTRENLGFRVDDSIVRAITLDLDLPTRERSLDLIGIPLDAGELSELLDRFLLQGRAADALPDFATQHAAEYAGSFIDQASGRLRVGFTQNLAANLAAAEALIGIPGRVEAFLASRTLQQLEATRNSVRADWRTGALDSYGVHAIGIDEQARYPMNAAASSSAAQAAAIGASVSRASDPCFASSA